MSQMPPNPQGPPPGPGWGQQPGPPGYPPPGPPGYPPPGPPGQGYPPQGAGPQWGQQPPAGGGSNNNTAVIVVFGLVALAVVGLGAILLLGGDDDDDGGSDGGGNGDRAAYVEVVLEQTDPAAGGFTDEQGECMAGAMVDAWGLDALEEVGTPDEIRAMDDEVEPEDLGLVQDEAWAGDVYDNMQDCMDYRDLILAGFEDELPAGSDALIDCMMEEISDGDLRDSFVAQTTGTDPSAGYNLGLNAGQACQHLAPGG